MGALWAAMVAVICIYAVMCGNDALSSAALHFIGWRWHKIILNFWINCDNDRVEEVSSELILYSDFGSTWILSVFRG